MAAGAPAPSPPVRQAARLDNRTPGGESSRAMSDEKISRVWPGPITAVTLFTEDLAETKRFYGEVFGLAAMFEDEDSAVFRFGGTLINLLRAEAAPELVAPAAVAGPEAGIRAQFTLTVDDVDAMCQDLATRGVTLLNGPVDRPWGIRTAAFRDPGGHVWELAGPTGTGG